MTILSYILALRPKQWLKNLMLFFPPFLGGRTTDVTVLFSGVMPFLLFCSASGAVYILNDVIDREQDKLHPDKRFRPIASGIIPPQQAIWMAALTALGAVAGSYFISLQFMLYLVLYIVISVAYSYSLKQMPLVDLFCISSGFIIRLMAGGAVFSIAISEWLFLSVFLLSLYLSAGKRLAESRILGKTGGLHRTSLVKYPRGVLDAVLYISGSSALITYTMYSLPRYPLIYSVPLCTFGLFRYFYRVKIGLSGDPTDALLTDVPLLVTSVFWAGLVGWSVYR